MKKLNGVIIALAVPVNGDYSVDKEGLRRLLEFLISSGVHGIFANGSMGAFALLPDSFQMEVIDFVVRVVDGRVPVLGGASETGTQRVIEKARRIQSLDVDGLVILPPYYYFCTQRELLRFFLTAADASSKPIFLYDNPRMTKNPIEVGSVVELAKHPNIRGLKISTDDMSKCEEVAHADIPRDEFSLFSGAERKMNLALRLGFDGIVGGLHNVIPDIAVRLFTSASHGNLAEADEIQQKINRVHRIFEIDGGWRGVEAAFKYMGIAAKATLPPYDIPMPEEKRQEVIRILREEGVRCPYPAIP